MKTDKHLQNSNWIWIIESTDKNICAGANPYAKFLIFQLKLLDILIIYDLKLQLH